MQDVDELMDDGDDRVNGFVDTAIYNPGYMRMPDWADSNEVYLFVTRDGRTYDIVWSELNERWELLPF